MSINTTTEANVGSPGHDIRASAKSDGPHYVIVGYNGNNTPCAALTVYAASAGLEDVRANAVGMLNDAGFPQVKSAEAISWPCRGVVSELKRERDALIRDKKSLREGIAEAIIKLQETACF